jgi:hypothetical protein
MRQHLANKDLLAGVKNSSDKAILIPTDIKYDAIADQAGTGEDLFDISPGMPRDGFVTNMGVPGTQRSFGIFVPWGLPKLSQPTFGDNSHPQLFLRSVLRAIIVRKIRTGKMKKPYSTGSGTAGYNRGVQGVISDFMETQRFTASTPGLIWKKSANVSMMAR